MNKNVLVISTSPRKGGDSDTLYDEFIHRAQESGNHTEKIFLASRNIKYCIGCGVYNTTRERVQKNDMAEILDKMVETGVIVLAIPVYFCTMDIQIKILIDRTVPRYTGVQNKGFCFIITAADAGRKTMERTIEGSRGFTQDCLTGAGEKGTIYGTGIWQVGEIRGMPAVKQAYEMGRNAQLRNKMYDGPEGVSCIFCVL